MADPADDTPPVDTPPAPEPVLTQQELINKSYQEATKALREKHVDDFNAYRVWWLKQNGIEWSPPLSERDKAKIELDKILAAHPDLLETLLPAADTTAG